MWVQAKTPGTLRILALGDSTTYGVFVAPEESWPAVLARALPHAEVLNGGRPGAVIGPLSPYRHRVDYTDLTTWWLSPLVGIPWVAYAPDVVLLSAGYNNAPRNVQMNANRRIESFHRYHPVGQQTKQLFYTSMLYTYGLEKWHYVVARMNPIGGDLTRFRVAVRRLLASIQAHQARPIVVLQAMRVPELPGLRDLSLDDPDAWHALHVPGTPTDPLIAQVFVEALRREAVAAQVPVIDPRPMLEAHRGPDPLFYDLIHPTASGYALIAHAVASHRCLESWFHGQPCDGRADSLTAPASEASPPEEDGIVTFPLLEPTGVVVKKPLGSSKVVFRQRRRFLASPKAGWHPVP